MDRPLLFLAFLALGGFARATEPQVSTIGINTHPTFSLYRQPTGSPVTNKETVSIASQFKEGAKQHSVSIPATFAILSLGSLALLRRRFVVR